MIVISRFRLGGTDPADPADPAGRDDPAGPGNPAGRDDPADPADRGNPPDPADPPGSSDAVEQDFLDRARRALDAFAACAGYQRGRIGRAADDPALWTVVTEWASVGAFRRSLSSFDVKTYAAPLLAESIEEPAAYEVIVRVDGGAAAEVTASDRAADAGRTRIGEAATPHAPRSVDPLI